MILVTCSSVTVENMENIGGGESGVMCCKLPEAENVKRIFSIFSVTNSHKPVISNGGGGSYQKALISPMSLVLGARNEKTTSWKSWSVHLLQVSHWTFDPCFKVM